ncbi:MAG TPA: hypothetical protein ENN29_07885 [Candidatus Hydrogenedentes bacterium]|nr:hypothetical protein [Candidatus Hydrogenedentota bacterium]
MTKRERFLAFANFERVDRPPRYAGYVPAMHEKLTAYLGEDPDAYFDMDRGKGAGLEPPEGFEFPDYSVYHPGREDGRDGFSIDENGCGHLNHGFYHFTEYISPLRNATSFEEVEKYPIASNATFSDAAMRASAAVAHKNGEFAQIFVGHIYENAWQVRGYEPFLMDLLTQREWAELLLDRFCENSLRVAVAAARAGYDCIATGDDVANQNAMMFHPHLWRAVMKPRWARVIAAARAVKRDIHVWYHSDGNITDILDDFVEIGVTILNPVQPECMDPIAIRKRYGKRLAFDGCVGTQSTFPFATPETMHKTVYKLADALNARNGGLMLSPTHVLEPEVPSENIEAFFEACDALRT